MKCSDPAGKVDILAPVSAAERLYEALGGKESGVELNLVDGAAHRARVQKSRGCNDQAVTFGSC